MGGALTGFVDGYCERTAPGLLDEPLNAATNLAFMLAAIVLWRLAARSGNQGDRLVVLPILLLFLTGVGSLAFHMLANRLSGALDILALSACLLLTIYAAARRGLGLGPGLALAWPLAMLVCAGVAGWLVPLPGSGYLGAFVVGLAMAVALLWHQRPGAFWVTGATVVFIPAYIMRAFDLPFCQSMPSGTHFGWHLLSALVLYLAIHPLAVRSHTLRR
ncbi:MAG: hypothetical protein RIM84_24555 [Alphaproteobacteria bacterium]